MNLKVSSFDLILCVEFLMKILQFVSVPQDESVSKPIAPGPTTTTVSKSKLVNKLIVLNLLKKKPLQKLLPNPLQHQANK